MGPMEVLGQSRTLFTADGSLRSVALDAQFAPMSTEPRDATGPANQGSSFDLVSVPLDYEPTKNADVLELDMGDGFVLYNHQADLVHYLNPSAVLVWQICDGGASIGELASDIAGAYGQDLGEVEAHLVQLVAELDALGLVSDGRLSQAAI